jgi:predicted lysophospholipase L1 biosynthesis ABC-type transport system permease subunit
MARFFFSGQDPVGKRFGPAGEQGYPIEIIGVAKDAKLGTPRDQRGAWYFPYQQNPRFLRLNWCIAVRTSSAPTAASASVLQALRDIEPGLGILRVNTVEEQLSHVLSRERLVAQLAAFFCLLAVLLTCVGLYGLISLRVVRRTAEIGIRLALGATPGSVVQMVVGESLLLVLAGAAMGVPIAIMLTRWLSAWLFGLEHSHASTFAAAILLMLGVAGFAALLPALRARRIDPMVALRTE